MRLSPPPLHKMLDCSKAHLERPALQSISLSCKYGIVPLTIDASRSAQPLCRQPISSHDHETSRSSADDEHVEIRVLSPLSGPRPALPKTRGPAFSSSRTAFRFPPFVSVSLIMNHRLLRP